MVANSKCFRLATKTLNRGISEFIVMAGKLKNFERGWRGAAYSKGKKERDRERDELRAFLKDENLPLLHDNSYHGCFNRLVLLTRNTRKALFFLSSFCICVARLWSSCMMYANMYLFTYSWCRTFGNFASPSLAVRRQERPLRLCSLQDRSRPCLRCLPRCHLCFCHLQRGIRLEAPDPFDQEPDRKAHDLKKKNTRFLCVLFSPNSLCIPLYIFIITCRSHIVPCFSWWTVSVLRPFIFFLNIVFNGWMMHWLEKEKTFLHVSVNTIKATHYYSTIIIII